MNAASMSDPRGGTDGGVTLTEVRAERVSLARDMEVMQGKMASLADLERLLEEWLRCRQKEVPKGVPEEATERTFEVLPIPDAAAVPAMQKQPFDEQAPLRGLTQADAATACLRRRSPMATMEIVDAMLAGGYEVPDPASGRRSRLGDSLFSLMRRRPKRFQKVAPGIWQLIDDAVAGGAS